MSCAPGEPCEEGRKRRTAIGVLGLMAVIFIVLSFASFIDSRVQAIPDAVSYTDYDAVQGKRVFQAYNCMGCHTIVGNGAYFAPDLTKTYAHVGPAWLEAFLPSAGSWPTRTAVQVQLQKPEVAQEAGVDSIQAYFDKFPAAAERVERRSAHASTMPDLPLSRDEIGGLIAFMKYTSEMDTEGWPPVPQVAGLTFPQALPMPAASAVESVSSPASGTVSAAPGNPAELGKKLALETGCTACHSADSRAGIGPGWGGLFGSDVELADGSQAHIDETYLHTAINTPDAQVAAGFNKGVMPAYANILDAEQVAAIVAYIRSLGGLEQ
ncbi:MAG TPA: c-type cytochrome [Woeseiaceae bacterium]|nr:c-type cytochrome [Woeseiaceae bacterium]